jgi:hypothetical protein
MTVPEKLGSVMLGMAMRKWLARLNAPADSLDVLRSGGTAWDIGVL